VNGRALVARLKEEAATLGLGTLGVAPIGPSDHAEALGRWLDRGHAATMDGWSARRATASDLTRRSGGRRARWVRRRAVLSMPAIGRRSGGRAAPGRYALGRTITSRCDPADALAGLLAREAPGATSRVSMSTPARSSSASSPPAPVSAVRQEHQPDPARGDSYVLLGEILTSVELRRQSRPRSVGTCTAASTNARPERSWSRTWSIPAAASPI